MIYYLSLDNLVIVDADTEEEAIQKSKEKFLELFSKGHAEIIVVDSE